MANKKTKKKDEQSPAATSSAKAESKKDAAKKAAPATKDSKPSKDAKSKKDEKAKKNGKPSLIARAKKYFSSVRTEMKRVVWPSKQELISYSVAVVASLIVVGVIIAGLDALISGGLVALSGLRG